MPGRFRPVLLIILTGTCVYACGSTSPTSPTPTPTAVQVIVPGNSAPVLAPGQSTQLMALGTYSTGSSDLTTEVIWRTSDPAIATVSNQGLVVALVPGNVDITATVKNKIGKLSVEVSRVCLYTLTPVRVVFGAFGGFQSVAVAASSADCRWTAASDAAWFPFAHNPNVSGSSSVSYNLPANTTPEPRSVRIIVTGTDGASAAHSVEQEKPICSYTTIPGRSTIPVGVSSGSFRVDVTPDDCRWNVVPTSGLPSIAVTSQVSNNTGDGTVTFVVPTNTSPLGSIRVVAVPNTSPSYEHELIR
jgi:hypothetical protein